VPGAAAVLCLPESVKEVLGQRVSRLSRNAHRLLRIASAIGREFDLTLLAKVAGQSDDDVLDGVDEAMTSGLVVEVVGEEDRFAFTHALMHATLYDGLSASRRVRIHRHIGEGLETITRERSGERLDALGCHWLAAARLAEPAEAVAYAQQAAQRALSGLAFEEAAKYYEQALRALERNNHVNSLLRCDLLIALSDAQRRAGNQVYGETAAKAVALANAADDAARLVRAALSNAGLDGIFLSTAAADADSDRLVRKGARQARRRG
jgi:predicted ATPase